MPVCMQEACHTHARWLPLFIKNRLLLCVYTEHTPGWRSTVCLGMSNYLRPHPWQGFEGSAGCSSVREETPNIAACNLECLHTSIRQVMSSGTVWAFLSAFVRTHMRTEAPCWPGHFPWLLSTIVLEKGSLSESRAHGFGVPSTGRQAHTVTFCCWGLNSVLTLALQAL